MYNFILQFDKQIIENEKCNRWKTASCIAFDNWTKDKSNLNSLLCAGAQVWYTLLIQNYYRSTCSAPINVELEQESILQNKLIEVTQWGVENFLNDAMFNCYFGYMIKVKPHYFLGLCNEYDYDYWKTKGISMIRHAYELFPQDPLIKAVFYESISYGNTEFQIACKNLWNTITPKLWGESEYQQHMFYILCGNDFYPYAYQKINGSVNN